LGSFKKVVGQRIEKYRIKAGFKSQQALAEKLQTDRSRVSEWERGIHEPKGKYRSALVKLLGVKDQDIFGIHSDAETDKALQNLPPLDHKMLATEVFNHMKDDWQLLKNEAPTFTVPKGYSLVTNQFLRVLNEKIAEQEKIAATAKLTDEEKRFIVALRAMNKRERRTVDQLLDRIISSEGKSKVE
jgi:transcriptional regulator with XRE-family HTH domain